MATRTPSSTKLTCFHCGEPCLTDKIQFDEKSFCCEGCRMVYSIINEKGLCEYYNLNDKPGFNHRVVVRADKFAFLDDPKVAARLITFNDGQQVHATFYLPQMHCSSCLYLLENLHRVAPGILSSKVNFTRREAEIVFSASESSVRKVAEALTSIGYEPWISLSDLKDKRPGISKKMIYQLGVAGFCFGNIMLMSFPEYLGISESETGLRTMFRWANLFLAIPVFLYSALPFYETSWKNIKHKYLSIDLPIALAIIITFTRSAWEVISGTGGGYFDSMTGIVFLMLMGRILQDKTYRQLSFDRDYTAYFPVAVSVLKDKEEIPTVLPEIKSGDTLLIHHEELIPADGILSRGKAYIDYSFVTGESLPVAKEVGEMVYAGGRQTGGNIEILTVKEVAQSYLTKLWNRDTFKEEEHTEPRSFVHLLGKYFTAIVLFLALASGVYWALHDQSRIWAAVTSVFIVACPCALLLSNTFTNGNILQILGRNRFYLRNAEIIEQVAKVDHIVFDKTGTLTASNEQDIFYEGKPLSARQVEMIAALSGSSQHPLSRTLARYLNSRNDLTVEDFKEETGAGMEAVIDGRRIRIGSSSFLGQPTPALPGTRVGVEIGGQFWGYYRFTNHYRQDMDLLLKKLQLKYKLSVISGDNEAERRNLEKLLGSGARLLFRQQPEDKLNYIRELQAEGQKVMMIGDGLNDAGALKQSDTGVAVAENINNFTPSSDAIIGAENLPRLYQFIRLCRANHLIVLTSFIVSLIYNAVANYYAVQGQLSPLIAAVLMPLSSMSILLISFGASNIVAKRMKL